MTRKTWFTLGGALTSVAVLATTVAVVQAQQKGAPPVDRGKRFIELPTENIIARSGDEAKAPAREFDNPKVAPGKVAWHKDLATACAASKTSGKPVLLFQMMGKLDDKFC
jgi:hypothetical protein